MRPEAVEWDDSEQYPEDEEDGMAPGDAPNNADRINGEADDMIYDSQPSPNWDESAKAELRRARRRQRINDHLATREYRDKRKEELREQRGGRFA